MKDVAEPGQNWVCRNGPEPDGMLNSGHANIANANSNG